MKEKTLNKFELYKIEGEYYSLEEIIGFIESNKELTNKCERLTRFNRAYKFRLGSLTEERNELQNRLDKAHTELNQIKSMTMFEFGNTYCSQESLEADGHAFARALGVGMTTDELAIETAENGYKPYTAEDF